MDVNNFTVQTLFGNDVNISDNQSFFDFHVLIITVDTCTCIVKPFRLYLIPVPTVMIGR